MKGIAFEQIAGQYAEFRDDTLSHLLIGGLALQAQQGGLPGCVPQGDCWRHQVTARPGYEARRVFATQQPGGLHETLGMSVLLLGHGRLCDNRNLASVEINHRKMTTRQGADGLLTRERVTTDSHLELYNVGTPPTLNFGNVQTLTTRNVHPHHDSEDMVRSTDRMRLPTVADAVACLQSMQAAIGGAIVERQRILGLYGPQAVGIPIPKAS